MNSPLELNSLLVPTDFSDVSRSAFDRALELAGGQNPQIILLHVIDPTLVDFAAVHGWASRPEIVDQMRQRAEREMSSYAQRAEGRAGIDAIVSEGVPFIQILRIAEDFAVDAIVIGKVGARGTIEKLLFGSTAEKVLRGSRRPVIVLPAGD